MTRSREANWLIVGATLLTLALSVIIARDGWGADCVTEYDQGCLRHGAGRAEVEADHRETMRRLGIMRWRQEAEGRAEGCAEALGAQWSRFEEREAREAWRHEREVEAYEALGKRYRKDLEK